MAIRNTSYINSALLALILHGLILLAMLYHIKFLPVKFDLGLENLPIMHSYVYEAKPETARSASSANAKLTETPGMQKLSLAKSTKMPSNAQQNTQAANPISDGKTASELINLLHAAIQEKQHYPASAQQMAQEGRVTVTFTLNRDGNINHLQIIQSSGTESLDEAAIAAVQTAAPFPNVAQYLHTAQTYSIDVAFELA